MSVIELSWTAKKEWSIPCGYLQEWIWKSKWARASRRGIATCKHNAGLFLTPKKFGPVLTCQIIIAINKERVALPNRMNFRISIKRGEEYFVFFWNFKQGFLIVKLIQNDNFRVEGLFFQQLYSEKSKQDTLWRGHFQTPPPFGHHTSSHICNHLCHKKKFATSFSKNGRNFYENSSDLIARPFPNYDSSVRYPAARGRRQGSEWTSAAPNPSQDGRQHEQATVLLYQPGWGPGETCKRAGSAWLYPQIRPLCYQRHASQRDGKVLCRRGGLSWARPPPSNDPIKDWIRLW